MRLYFERLELNGLLAVLAHVRAKPQVYYASASRQTLALLHLLLRLGLLAGHAELPAQLADKRTTDGENLGQCLGRATERLALQRIEAWGAMGLSHPRYRHRLFTYALKRLVEIPLEPRLIFLFSVIHVAAETPGLDASRCIFLRDHLFRDALEKEFGMGLRVAPGGGLVWLGLRAKYILKALALVVGLVGRGAKYAATADISTSPRGKRLGLHLSPSYREEDARRQFACMEPDVKDRVLFYVHKPVSDATMAVARRHSVLPVQDMSRGVWHPPAVRRSL